MLKYLLRFLNVCFVVAMLGACTNNGGNIIEK